VTAPVSGVAGRIARSEGSLVSAGQDSSLLTTMIKVDPIWIRFSLSESDSRSFPTGGLDRIKSAEVRLALPDGSRYPLAAGSISPQTQIDPSLPPRNCARRSPIRACSSFRASSCGSRWRRASVTTCSSYLKPRSSRPEKTFLGVHPRQGKQSRIRPVQVGEWLGSRLGDPRRPQPGDRVILDNLLKVRPGVAVSPQSPAEAKAAAPAAK